MPWDVTDQYIRSGHKTPGDPCRTITISADQGIKAIYCKYGDKWAIQSYLFSKAKGWTVSKAKAWFQQHRESVKETRHDDFQQILDRFVMFFGDEEGTQMYKDFLKQNGLDETKPYTIEDQILDEKLRESFEWTEPLIKYWKKDKEAKYYKTRLLTANISMNLNDYTNPEDMTFAASNLGWRPLNIDHDHRLRLPFPDNRLEIGRVSEEGNSIEAVLRIHNESKKIQDMIKNRKVVHPSIEAHPICGITKQDGHNIPTCGYYLDEVALLRKKYHLPGDPLSQIFPMPLNESLATRLVESLQTHDHGVLSQMKENITPRGENKKMTKKEEKTQEQFTDLPDSSFACIVGEGDSKIRKLPIHDAAHTRNAMARHNQTEGCQTAEVKAKICRAARKFNIENAFEKGGFCYTGESVESIEEMAKKDNKINELTQKVYELEKDGVVKDETIIQSKESIERMAKKIAKMERDASKTTSKDAENKETIKNLHARIAELETTQNELKGENVELKDQAEIANSEKTELGNQKDNLEEANAKLRTRVSKLSAECDEAKSETAKAKQDAINETRARATLQEDNADLREQEADSARRISELSTKRVEDARRIHKLEEELGQTKDTLQEALYKLKKTRRIAKIKIKR